MTIFYWLVLISWFIFISYWLISSWGVKRDLASNVWWSGRAYAVRLTLAAIIILVAVFGFSSVGSDLKAGGTGAAEIGSVLTIVGIGLAIWARFHLGKNWSSRPALKENHELVTTGPYRFLRHPIYTGVLLAEFGTALVVGYVWFAALIFGIIVFVRRIFVEEKIMIQQFPNQYPAYKKRTKALIPFVW